MGPPSPSSSLLPWSDGALFRSAWYALRRPTPSSIPGRSSLPSLLSEANRMVCSPAEADLRRSLQRELKGSSSSEVECSTSVVVLLVRPIIEHVPFIYNDTANTNRTVSSFDDHALDLSESLSFPNKWGYALLLTLTSSATTP